MDMNTCKKHLRDQTIYDIDLNLSICDRCALFDPSFKSHSFIQVKDLSQYSEQLFMNFSIKLNSLKLQQQNSLLTSHVLKQMSLKKISNQVAIINKTYSELIRELERERDSKIHQVQRNIQSIAQESKKSINLLISKEYKQITKTNQALSQLLKQKKYSQICQTIKDNLLNKKIQSIQKDLQMIYFQFNNKINYQAPQILSLFKKISQKEQMLINQNQIEIIPKFDSLKQSRVSTQTDRTQISFGSIKGSKQKSVQLNKIDPSSITLKSTLNTLKVHSKSEVRNLYIKNNTKSITMTQLDMNNNEALQAIKKCSFNNFVAKLDLSYNNQITQRLLIQLKREKIQSKHLKQIVIKGIKLDSRELKKQGIQPDSKGTITIGNIKIEY